MKTQSFPAAFPTVLSIPPPLLFAFLHRPPTNDMTRPVRKCLSATTGSHSPDASAVLSHRPSDRAPNLDNDADEAPDVLAGRRPPGHAKALDVGSLLPSSKPGQPTYYTSSLAHRDRQGRVSTLTGCVTTALPLSHSFADLYHGWFWSRDRHGLRCDQANGEHAVRSARAPLKNWCSSSREQAQNRHWCG
jgi:hypothetical protein